MSRMRGFASAAVLALVLWAGSAPAQTVDIRSGEHAAFSRLVLYFGNSVAWELGRGGSGYRLRVQDAQRRYDVSEVFDFIPRARLTDVRPTGDGLELAIGCRCHADAFEYRPGILVIDIKDGPAPAGSPFEQLLSQPQPPVAKPQARASAASAQGRVGEAPHRSTAVTAGAPAAPLPLSPTGFLFARARQPTSVADTEALREELARGIGRATADGLLVPARGRNSDPSEADGVSPEASGLTLRTGLIGETETADPPAQACLPAERFDVAAWGSAGLPIDLMAAARTQLLTDTDRPAADAVLQTARTHVYLGFGAEAEQILKAHGMGTPAAAVTAAIARVIDAPPRTPEPILLAQAACDGPAALWALLGSAQGARPSADVASAPVVRTLGALPLHLRRHLAPRVSERLRMLGRDTDAASARATLTRATREPGAAMVVETAEGVPTSSQTTTTLHSIARGQSDAALAARAQLLRRRGADDEPLDAELRREVEAQIHSSKGSEVSDQLVGAYVDALAKTGSHAEALAILERLARSDYANDYALDTHGDRFTTSLVDTAGVGEFVTLARDLASGPLLEHLPPATADRVANRLHRTGFAELAPPYERRSEGDVNGRDDAAAPRQLALAEAALEDGRPAETLARLDELSDPAALRLRAAALQDLGAHAEAAKIYAELEQSDRAAQQYWRAGRWGEAAALLPDGPRRRLAEALATGRSTSAGSTAPPGAGPAPSGGSALTAPVAQRGAVGSGDSETPAALFDAARASVSTSDLPSRSEAAALIDHSRALREIARDLVGSAPPADGGP